MVFAASASDPQPFRIFEQRPAPQEVTAYAEQIVATGHPELMPDLHQGPIGADEPFWKLRPLSVAKDRRTDGLKLPCPRCTANRFFAGWMIYLTELKAVAFVGNDCAGDAALAQADREYQERLKRETEEEYLLSTLPGLGASLAEIQQLAPRAEVAGAVHKALRTKAKGAFEALRGVARNSGLLAVDEVLQTTSGGPTGMRTSGSNLQTRSVQFGRLDGQKAFTGSFDPFKALQDVRATFGPLQCANADAALEAVAGLSDGERETIYKSVRAAHGKLSKVRADLDEFAAFFSDANLGRVNDWGSHRDAPVSVKLILRAQGGGASRLDFTYRAQGTPDFGHIDIGPGFI